MRKKSNSHSVWLNTAVLKHSVIWKSNQATGHKASGAWYYPEKTPALSQCVRFALCLGQFASGALKPQVSAACMEAPCRHSDCLHKHTKANARAHTKPLRILSDIILIYSVLWPPQCQVSQPPCLCLLAKGGSCCDFPPTVTRGTARSLMDACDLMRSESCQYRWSIDTHFHSQFRCVQDYAPTPPLPYIHMHS